MGLSILFFAQLVSVFRSRFLVLITPAHPEDWPLSPPTVDVTTWVGGVLTDEAPVLSTQQGPQILCRMREGLREDGSEGKREGGREDGRGGWEGKRQGNG